MLTIVKDEFTGFRKINSKFYGLTKFIEYEGPMDIYLRYMRDKTGVSDAFDLLYLESENGQGNIVIRVCSSVAKFSGNTDWPHWEDNWPMLVDGEKVSLKSSSTNSFERDYELKVYDLPVDVFNKLCNAKEVKFSLRGRNNKIEGVLTNQHQTLLKAFEQYCFGDENEGIKLIESIGSIVSQNNGNDQSQNQEDTTTYSCHSCKSNNIVPNSWETFRCHNCGKDNSIIKSKNLTDEEKTKHENKVVDLIKDKKTGDAIQFYAANFGYTVAASKPKVKELAEKNGFGSIYKKWEKRDNKMNIGCLVIFAAGVVLILLFITC